MLSREPAATSPAAPSLAQEEEAARVLRICNACRYCEGFCAVFPAMTRRLEFPAADVHYLANLCHNCGACLHACQYAPPHEFAVNVPRAMAHVRVRTYAHYAWPAVCGRLYRRNGLTVALVLVAALMLFLVLAAAGGGLWRAPSAGDFYAVFPHETMVALFAPPFLFAVLALAMGVRRFWRDLAPGPGSAAAAAEASYDALRLKQLGGGHGEGCHDADDAWTHARRRLHHAVFYGFAACFLATGLATLYHYVFGQPAPYPLASAPVLLGTAGGMALVIGSVGLLWLGSHRHPLHADPDTAPMDRALTGLLLLVGTSGLALLVCRGTAAMALLLAVHLACVAALFLTMPYGKFAHGVYRFAALLKWSIERRQSDRVQIGSE
jgi:citrate/tricarballylate utilization protein